MDEKKAASSAGKSARKVPRKVTKDRLRNIALHHLERYASSAQNLKRVLNRRVLKAARHHETDLAEAQSWIDEVVDALERSGAVDDRHFAGGKAVSMIRRGQSPAKVRSYLTSKGVNRDIINQALAHAEESLGNPAMLAARAYAQRRRIGPYRRTKLSREIRTKELAVMGRAGFDYETARKIVDATDESEIDEN